MQATKITSLAKLRKDKEDKEKSIGFVAKQFGSNPASQEILRKLDPDVVIDSPLTTTQFLLLHENARKRQALQEAKAEHNRLKEANTTLQEQRGKDRTESYEVIEFLQKENREKQRRIEELRDLARKADEDAQRKIDEFERKFKEDRKSLREQHERTTDELRDRIGHMESELKAVKDYKLRRDVVETDLKRLREENEDLKRENEKFAITLERKYVEQNFKMRQDFDAQLQGTLAEARAELEKSMDEQMRGVVLANKKLQQEIKVYAATHDDLKRQKQALEAELRQCRLDLQLRDGGHEELVTRAALQARELREANARMERLELSMTELATAIDQERATMQDRLEDYRHQASHQISRLNDALQYKDQELVKIKRLAKEILRQRTDVETFLVASLHDVREQVELERADVGRSLSRQNTIDRHSDAAASPSHGGPDAVRPSLQLGGAASTSGGRVDLTDLTWSEKERVLRVLFRRINDHGLTSGAASQYAQSVARPPLSGLNSNASSARSMQARTSYGPGPGDVPPYGHGGGGGERGRGSVGLPAAAEYHRTPLEGTGGNGDEAGADYY